MRVYLVYQGCSVAFARELFHALLEHLKTVRDGVFEYHHGNRECRVSVPADDKRALESMLETVRAVGIAPHDAVMAEEFIRHTEHTVQTATEFSYWIQHSTPKAVNILPYILAQLARG